jgi:hypothetical protein
VYFQTSRRLESSTDLVNYCQSYVSLRSCDETDGPYIHFVLLLGITRLDISLSTAEKLNFSNSFASDSYTLII